MTSKPQVTQGHHRILYKLKASKSLVSFFSRLLFRKYWRKEPKRIFNNALKMNRKFNFQVIVATETYHQLIRLIIHIYVIISIGMNMQCFPVSLLHL